MKTVLDLDVSQADRVRTAVSPSLRDSDAVRFSVSGGETVRVDIEAETLGTLRGATNTALMLTRLSSKILEA